MLLEGQSAAKCPVLVNNRMVEYLLRLIVPAHLLTSHNSTVMSMTSQIYSTRCIDTSRDAHFLAVWCNLDSKGLIIYHPPLIVVPQPKCETSRCYNDSPPNARFRPCVHSLYTQRLAQH